MLAYLGTFGISIGLTFWAESLRKKGKRNWSSLCLVLAVLLVVLLAGLRDYTVGTDTQTYVAWVDRAVGYESFRSYQEAWYAGREILSDWIVYAAARIGWTRFFFLSFAVVTYGTAMAALVLLREAVSLPYAWAAYLFFMYGPSLNQIRQSAAMVLVLCAFTLLFRKKYLGFALLTVAAVSFHNTAVLALPVLILYLILKKWNTRTVKAVIVTAVVIGAFFAIPILRFVDGTGILGSRFSGYLANPSVSPFTLNPLILRLPFLGTPLFFYRDFVKEEPSKSCVFRKHDADFLLILLVIEIATVMQRSISVELFRLCFYFQTFRCVTIGRTVRALEKNPSYKNWIKVFKAALFAVYVLIWLYQVVYRRNDWTFPYTSESLGIGPDPLAVMIDRLRG